MEPYEFLEWNNPFTGCTEREQLLTELQREYNDAIPRSQGTMQEVRRSKQEYPSEMAQQEPEILYSNHMC